MTDKDQKMLESALWHISNSVTNGKSQTTECEITKWLKEKFNSLPTEQASDELVDAARNIRDTLYLEEGKRDVYGNPYFLQDTILKAVIAGANWQKEQTINKASQWLNENVVEYHPRKGELRPIVNINAFRDAMEKEGEQ